jgi:hypothetical protein
LGGAEIYTDYVNVLATRKHCRENPKALSVVINDVGLELNVTQPKLKFKFLKSMQDEIKKEKTNNKSCKTVGQFKSLGKVQKN